MNGEVVLAADLNLQETLECGQCFRWNAVPAPDGEIRYQGVALQNELTVSQRGDRVTFHCTKEDFQQYWKSYFDLGTNYGEIHSQLCDISPVLSEAAAYAPGIHILRQDPWEALCSFILSQNNNIPRIKGLVERLCRYFGARLPSGAVAFPGPEVLAALEISDLVPVRAGFRAKYILDAARSVLNGAVDLKKIREAPISYGRRELQKIYGVGPKVAECTLLYGFYKTEGFPMDVWMRRAMQKLLPGLDPETFGKNAGLAQQYLFHYSRMHPDLVA